MVKESECVCDAAPKLIFACSRAADVGETADRTAGRLTKDSVGKMYCLAGSGWACLRHREVYGDRFQDCRD